MEELVVRYDQLLKAYKNLRYMSRKFVKISQDPALRRVLQQAYVDDEGEEEDPLRGCRESVIKRFELCYDLTWKFFKALLRYRFLIEVANPRAAFEEAHKQNIITTDELAALLRIVRSRNEVAHIYDEAFASEVSEKILEHNKLFSELAKKLQVIMNDLKYV